LAGLAAVQLRGGDVHAAIATATRAVALVAATDADPAVAPWVVRAEAHLALGNLAQAVADAERVIADVPRADSDRVRRNDAQRARALLAEALRRRNERTAEADALRAEARAYFLRSPGYFAYELAQPWGGDNSASTPERE
ncbi:MAG: hypothetical protein AAF721_28460, partial [Myxococcota bacterium]